MNLLSKVAGDLGGEADESLADDATAVLKITSRTPISSSNVKNFEASRARFTHSFTCPFHDAN